MKSNEIRDRFVNFFVNKGHKYLPSSPVTPEGDATLLFTNSGMVQFKNNFTGKVPSSYGCAVTHQKCIRAGGKHNDLDNVGYTGRHHTFFEMLGNFSFGDYFKEDAIVMAWEFLTEDLKIDKEKLIVTVYTEDKEAYDIWHNNIGLSEDRIIKISTSDNFWEMGDTGPCGPCTEIFYDHGEHVEGGKPGSENENGDRFTEIWNIVFMQYEKIEGGEMKPLERKCIDTGIGLERITAVLQGVHDNYKTDSFDYLIKEIENITNSKVTNETEASFKVIADHIRSVSFMISDGVIPSRDGRGYVLRRIIRRAIRHLYAIGEKKPAFYKLANTFINNMGEIYSNLKQRESFIIETIKNEEEKFQDTFVKGMDLLAAEIKKTSGSTFSGKVAFQLYETYGFPVDLTEDILLQHKLKLNQEEFDLAEEEHRNLAKKSWKGNVKDANTKLWESVDVSLKSTEFVGYHQTEADAQIIGLFNDGIELCDNLKAGEEGYIVSNETPFYAEKGGQVGDTGLIQNKDFVVKVINTTLNHEVYTHHIVVQEGEVSSQSLATFKVDAERRKKITIHHTATHLLQEALREILGDHVFQQGSLVSEGRLRFDISYNSSISKSKLLEIEKRVNSFINQELEVHIENMKVDEAIKQGAIALFGEKYPEEARTVQIGKFGKEKNITSFELCGGTHVSNTSKIRVFKILSEASIAAGIRRIEAIAGEPCLDHIYKEESIMNSIFSLFSNVKKEDIPIRVETLIQENKQLKEDIENIKYKALSSKLNENVFSSKLAKHCSYYNFGSEINSKDLKKIAEFYFKFNKNSCVLILCNQSDKLFFMLAADKEVSKNLDKNIWKDAVDTVSGKGGGNSSLFQGTCDDTAKEQELIEVFKNKVS